jgi:hypothetical protein
MCACLAEMRSNSRIQFAILDLTNLGLVLKMWLSANAILFTQIFLAAPKVIRDRSRYGAVRRSVRECG